MDLLAWSPSTPGCSQHPSGILSLNPTRMLFLPPGTSQLGLDTFPCAGRWGRTRGCCREVLRLQGAGGWTCGLVAATRAAAARSPDSMAGMAEPPFRASQGGSDEAGHKARVGRACPLPLGSGMQSILCKTLNTFASLASWLALRAAC